MRSSRWRWHLDEVFVKIGGVQHYLWRAVEHKGEGGARSLCLQAPGQEGGAAIPEETHKRHGRPEVLVTDKLRSYGAALKEIGSDDIQVTGYWENNRAENSHQLLR